MSKFTDSIPAFQQYKISNDNVEVLTQSLYDTLLYPAAGTTQLQFFSNPFGQGLSAQHGWANQPKSWADTNLTNAGMLPAGQGFLIEGIEVKFEPGSSATANTFALQSPVTWNATAAATLTSGVDDVNAFYSTGYLALTIMSKPYLTESPIGRFPPKTTLQLDAAAATNAAATAEVVLGKLNAEGRPYYLNVPLPIQESENFSATLNWPAAVATPTTKNGQVKMIFDGQLYRKSQ